MSSYEVFSGDQIGDGTLSRVLGGAAAITGGFTGGFTTAGTFGQKAVGFLNAADGLVSGYEIATGDTIGDGTLSGVLNLASVGSQTTPRIFGSGATMSERIGSGLRLSASAGSLVNTGDPELQRALRAISIANGAFDLGVQGSQAVSTGVAYADYSLFHARRALLSPLAYLVGDRTNEVTTTDFYASDASDESSLVIYVNGLNNTPEEAAANALDMSMGAGVPVRNIYNDTTVNHLPAKFRNSLGLGGDLLEAFFEFGGYGIVDATTAAVAQQTNEALASRQHENVVLVGHSQGGIKVSGAFSGIRPDLRGKVSAITFGSAHTKPIYGARSHVDVHREKDFVSAHIGMRVIRNLVEPVTNALALTNSQHLAIARGNSSERYTFAQVPLPSGEVYNYGPLNSHSYRSYDQQSGVPIGYNSIVPTLIQEIANRAE